MLKFYVKHGMVVEEIHEIISFKQNKWLEKYIRFKTQNRAKNDFEKDLSKLLVKTASGKMIEIVRNRLKIEFIKKHGYKKVLKQQSKLTFSGIHKSHENSDSYTFQQNEVLMDKPTN